MHALCLYMLLSVVGQVAAESFGSALAPYPALHESYGAEVDEVLSTIEKNAPADGAFAAAVSWTVESSREFKSGREDFGPFSSKVLPNWHSAGPGSYWSAGSYAITAVGDSFVIEKAADDESKADWWQKVGEHTYSRAWSEDWPTIWRFHHDAFEAGMLGYSEGLGLLLWAFSPGEYIARADYLEVGADREIDGVLYKTLVATPSWIQVPLFLENRTHYPFNESTLIAWAPLRPVITYLVDPSRGMIVGAEFVYHRVLRSGPKDWTAGSKPNGVRIECLATEIAQSGETWYPTEVTASVYQGEDPVRATSLRIELHASPASLLVFELPEGKRKLDPWPKYRASVYASWLASGDLDHANRLGLAAALAYEGTDIAAAQQAIAQAIAALEQDPMLLPETFGGVDWEFGFPVYELFWKLSDQDAEAVWGSFPASSTWTAVLAKAVHLYQEYRPEENERIQTLLDQYSANFEARLAARAEAELWESYVKSLQADIATRQSLGDQASVEHLQRLLAEAQAASAK